MAKHHLMGDASMSEEDRNAAEQLKTDQDAQQVKWLAEEKEKQANKKVVTLEQLLNTTMQPSEDRIVVWRDKADLVTEGGILKPEEVLERERPSRGTVIAVGPGLTDPREITNYLLTKLVEKAVNKNEFQEVQERVGEFKKVKYAPGDRIMFGKFAGTPVPDPETEEELLIMRPPDIFCKL